MKVWLIGIVAALAVAIGVLYAVNAWLTANAEAAFPPRGERRTVEGTALHYLDRGQGPLVVLIHHAPGSLNDFAVTLVDRLAARYRVIAVDRPGHGYSARPDEPVTPGDQARLIRTLIRTLAPENPILVGFSFGGAVALAYALDYPDDVQGVVALAPATHEWPTEVDWKWRMPTWPIVGRVLVDTLPQILGRLDTDRLMQGAFAPAAIDPDYLKAGFPLILRPSNYRANAADIRLLKPFLRAQTPRYPTLKPPLAILTDDQDNVVSAEVHSRALHRAVPHSTLTFLTGGGHLLPYTRRDEIIAAIDRMASRP